MKKININKIKTTNLLNSFFFKYCITKRKKPNISVHNKLYVYVKN